MRVAPALLLPALLAAPASAGPRYVRAQLPALRPSVPLPARPKTMPMSVHPAFLALRPRPAIVLLAAPAQDGLLPALEPILRPVAPVASAPVPGYAAKKTGRGNGNKLFDGETGKDADDSGPRKARP